MALGGPRVGVSQEMLDELDELGFLHFLSYLKLLVISDVVEPNSLEFGTPVIHPKIEKKTDPNDQRTPDPFKGLLRCDRAIR